MTVINEVDQASIEQIAKDLFGSNTQVRSAEEIRPVVEHGVLKICGCNGNICYIVSLAGHHQRHVFRFNRNRRPDRFDHEQAMYELIQTNTGIPTPRIHTIDRSKSVVPTSYMVMDYMEGDAAEFLSHPRNPVTTAGEKDEIERALGRCHAAIHSLTKEAAPDEFTGALLGRLSQLRDVVQDGQYSSIPLEKVELCAGALSHAPHLQVVSAISLCVADSEVFFARTDGRWQLAFLCDTEWMEYGDLYQDLALRVCAPQYFWELTSPLTLRDPPEVLSRPFFQGYAETRKIDVERLRSACIYYHFAGICSILDCLCRPDKREGALAREPVCAQLVDTIIETCP